MPGPATYDRATTPQAEDGDTVFLGLNTRLSPENLPPGYVAAAVNVRMRNGQIEPRKGVVKPGWLNVVSPGNDFGILPVTNFYGAGVFKDPNSVEYVFTASDGFIFRHRPHNSRFAVPLPTGVKILSRVTFTQAFNKLFCFRGKHLATLVLPDVDTGFQDLVPHYSASATYPAAILATGQTAGEIAYGPFQAIASLTSVGDLATAVLANPHGYVTGADITIQGATETGYNGRWNIKVIDENTFTYNFHGASASPATGAPKCSNMSHYYRALGSSITLGVGELTSATTTATVTHAAHGFTTGQYVTIAGATPVVYNGTYPITVTDSGHFTYQFAGGTSPATGTITAQTSTVLAGQSPDTSPGAWQQIFNILPNADDAIYINNRLLVPTAFTPGTLEYDSTSTYTKKDFIVATDIQDEIHFDFQNEFRINQGSDDEIVTLIKYAPDTAIVFKGKSWGILSNIAMDLSNLSLDMRTDGYGACAPSATVAGKDVLFPVSKRGIVSIAQNELGQTRSVDIPFSNDITREIGRINWNYADKIRLAYWDDKIYMAAPLDAATVESQNLLVVTGAGNNFANQYYQKLSDTFYTDGDLNAIIQQADGTWHLIVDGSDAYSNATLTGQWSTVGTGDTSPPPPIVNYYAPGISNTAVLVYDFRAGDSGAWQCVDSGDAFCPMEFFKATYNGVERLFYLAKDGYVNMVEEATSGDQVHTVTEELTRLGFTPIATRTSSRGYTFSSEAQKKFKNVQVVLGVWDASYSLSTRTGAANSLRYFLTDKTYSRFSYIRPFEKEPYIDGNTNDDFATPGRGNYAVYLRQAAQPWLGLLLGSAGVNCAQYQEITERVALSVSAQRYTQVLVSNNAGRCVVKSIAPMAAEGQRRGGAML